MKKTTTTIFLLLSVLSFAFSQNYLLNESFESGIPTTWNMYQMGDTNPGWELTGYAHTGNSSIKHDYANVDVDDWLVTEQLFVDNSFYTLSFWQAETFEDDIELHEIIVSTGSGDPNDGDFTDVIYSRTFGYESWEFEGAELSAYNGQNIYIAFRYYGNNADEWFLDDIVVSCPPENDLGIAGISPIFFNSGEIANPEVVIKNYGTINQDNVEVTVELTDGASFTNSITLLVSIEAGEKISLPMGDYFPDDGTVTLTANLSFSDANPGNNIKSSEKYCGTVSYSNNAYAQRSNNDKFVYCDLSDGTQTEISTTSGYSYQNGGEFAEGALYFVRFYTDLFLKLEDGTDILIGEINNINEQLPFVYEKFYGLAYNEITKKWYTTIPNTDAGTCQFGEIDPIALTFNKISSFETVIAGFDFANDGFLYGPSNSDDNLYKINPETGAFFVVGNTGLTNIQFGQDVSWDTESETLYSYPITYNGSLEYFFGKYDIGTGVFSEIAPLSNGESGRTLAILNAPLSQFLVNFNVTNGTYPIEDANIFINGENLTTNTYGDASIELYEGDYEYVATANNYDTVTNTVNVIDTNINVDIVLSEIVSVDELFNGLKFYPNPTNGIIYINYNNIQSITIADITGKVIIENPEIKLNNKLDLTSFGPGIYIIKIETDKEIMTTKLIIR